MAIIKQNINILWKPPLGTPINPSHPLSKGLVGAWLFNEGGGTSAYDISGNNNTGSLSAAGASWASGNTGSAVKLVQASPGYVNVGSSNTLQPLKMSFFIWSNSSSFTAGNTYFASRRNIGSGNGWSLYYGHLSAVLHAFLFDAGGQGQDLAFNTGPSFNKWCHAGFTYDGTTLITYFNGKFNTSVACTYTNNTINPTNGCLFGVYGNLNNMFGFNGLIDLPLVYNRALSAAEVQQLYLQPFCFMQQRKLIMPYVSSGAKIYGFAGAGGVQGTGQIGIAS